VVTATSLFPHTSVLRDFFYNFFGWGSLFEPGGSSAVVVLIRSTATHVAFLDFCNHVAIKITEFALCGCKTVFQSSELRHGTLWGMGVRWCCDNPKYAVFRRDLSRRVPAQGPAIPLTIYRKVSFCILAPLNAIPH